MNIGKLVREKMKMHRTDCSGEYVDNMGKHFTMAAEGDGYTVKYGGDAKREVSISKEQGIKLAGGCRKLNLAAEDDKKKLASGGPSSISAGGVSANLRGYNYFAQYKGKTIEIALDEGSWNTFIDGRRIAQLSAIDATAALKRAIDFINK